MARTCGQWLNGQRHIAEQNRNQPIMWTLFADEISDDFTEQCRVAAGLGCSSSRCGALGVSTSLTWMPNSLPRAADAR